MSDPVVQARQLFAELFAARNRTRFLHHYGWDAVGDLFVLADVLKLEIRGILHHSYEERDLDLLQAALRPSPAIFDTVPYALRLVSKDDAGYQHYRFSKVPHPDAPSLSAGWVELAVGWSDRWTITYLLPRKCKAEFKAVMPDDLNAATGARVTGGERITTVSYYRYAFVAFPFEIWLLWNRIQRAIDVVGRCGGKAAAEMILDETGGED